MGTLVLVLVGAIASGLSGAQVMLGLLATGVAIVGLLRGRVRWAGVRDRRQSLWAAGLAVVALAVGGSPGGAGPSDLRSARERPA